MVCNEYSPSARFTHAICALPILQTTSLGIHRADYMVDLAPPSVAGEMPHLSLKQVEVNTIASSYAGLESRMKNFHE